MDIQIDKTLTQRIVCAKSKTRFFTFEFPHDSDIYELLGVMTELKTTIWNTINEQEKKKEAEKKVEQKKEEEQNEKVEPLEKSSEKKK